MRGSLKLSEAQKAEWAEVTTWLRTHVKNLDKVLIVPKYDETHEAAISDKGARLYQLVGIKYGYTRKAIRHMSDDTGIVYNTLLRLLTGTAKGTKYHEDKIAEALGIPDDERSKYFDKPV